MRTLIAIALLLTAFAGYATDCRTVTVKYRTTPVCLDNFEHQQTSRSSLVRGAWYDASNQYLVVSLKGTRYHYCRMPHDIWHAFRAADSYGRFYLQRIKGRFDCRLGGVPDYSG
jgi:hypothetical protein